MRPREMDVLKRVVSAFTDGADYVTVDDLKDMGLGKASYGLLALERYGYVIRVARVPIACGNVDGAFTPTFAGCMTVETSRRAA